MQNVSQVLKKMLLIFNIILIEIIELEDIVCHT